MFDAVKRQDTSPVRVQVPLLRSSGRFDGSSIVRRVENTNGLALKHVGIWLLGRQALVRHIDITSIELRLENSSALFVSN